LELGGSAESGVMLPMIEARKRAKEVLPARLQSLPDLSLVNLRNSHHFVCAARHIFRKRLNLCGSDR